MMKEIIDTTLRDGEQAPGVSFTTREKIDIAQSLMSLGIDEIEAGIPIMGSEQVNFIKWLSKESSRTRISTWSRLNIEDVNASIKTGVEAIHISIPVSNYHLQTQIGSWSNLMHKLEQIIAVSKDNFNYVSLGLQDSFRAEEQRLEEVCSFAEANKLQRIRFSDTVGNTTPENVKKMITRYRGKYSGVIDFHGHNDLGLGSANSLAALENGADSVNVTVNGIGERAGNTALEQIAFIIDSHKEISSNLDITKINKLCQMVSIYSKRAIPVDKPIVGELVFTHESGIHSHGLQQNDLAYQPFSPEGKGLSRSRIVVGTHSGCSNVSHILTRKGINFSPKNLPKIVQVLKQRAADKKGFLTNQEVIDIYKKEIGI